MQEFEPPTSILDFLTEIGAGRTAHHAGRSLAAHLAATYSVLCRWQQGAPVAIAGLCHSLYGTDAFDTACLGIEDRDKVRQVIGHEAEQLSFLFGAMEREAFLVDPGSGYIKNRFNGRPEPVSTAECSGLCHILLANELDLVIAKKGTGKPDKIAKKVGPIFEIVRPWLTLLAISDFQELSKTPEV